MHLQRRSHIYGKAPVRAFSEPPAGVLGHCQVCTNANNFVKVSNFFFPKSALMLSEIVAEIFCWICLSSVIVGV